MSKLPKVFDVVASFQRFGEDLACKLLLANQVAAPTASSVYQSEEEAKQDRWQWFFSSARPESVVAREGVPLRHSATRAQFLHRSLLEYYVATAIYQEWVDILNLQREGREQEVQRRLDADSLLNRLQDTEGRPLLLKELSILNFLCERVEHDADLQAILWRQVLASKEKSALAPQAAQAVTILNYANYRFIEHDFENTHLMHADLSEANLESAKFQNAKLQHVNFERAWLHNADLRKTDLTNVRWGEKPISNYGYYIGTMALDPTGRYRAHVLSCTIVIEDLETGKRQELHAPHSINDIAWSSIKELASGCSDNTVIIWDLKKGKPGKILEGHEGEVKSVAWSATGQLASGSEDKTIIIWDLENNRPYQKLEGHKNAVISLAWSPTGELASGEDSNYYPAEVDLIVWDWVDAQPHYKLVGHQSQILSLAWSAAGELASGGLMDDIIIWDLKKRELRQRLLGHEERITSLAWNSIGELASGSMDNSVIIWDLIQGQPRQQFKGHENNVSSVVWGPKGELMSSSDDYSVITWDLSRTQPRAWLSGHKKCVSHMGWSSKGELMSIDDDDNIIRWDKEKGQPDKLWQKSVNHNFERIGSMAWNTKGELALGHWYNGTITIWNPAQDRIIQQLKGHKLDAIVNSIAWSATGDLASGGNDKWVIVWDLEKGEPRQKLTAHAKNIRKDLEASESVNSVAWSLKGELASGSQYGRIIIWDLEHGTPRQQLQTDWGLNTLTWSPLGVLASSSSLACYSDFRIWDLEKGSSFQPKEEGTKASVLAWGPNGELASGGGGNCIIIWDLITQKPKVKLMGLDGEVYSLQWFKDNNRLWLAAGNASGLVKLWQRVGPFSDNVWQLLWSNPPQLMLCTQGCQLQGAIGLNVEQQQLLKQKQAQFADLQNIMSHQDADDQKNIKK